MARKSATPKMATNRPKGVAEILQANWRQKNATGVDWKEVSALSLRCALTTVLREGGAVMIAGAMGGRGVMLKIFLGDENVREFAADAEEVNQLLESLVESMGEGSEDVHEAMRGGVE